MSINRVTLLGRIGSLEAKMSKSGMAILTLSIATDERKKDLSGEWTKETDWHSVVFFGKSAENLQNFVQKGHKLYIEGRLKTEKWLDDAGVQKSATKVIGDKFDLIEKRDAAQQQAKPVQQSYANKDSVPFDDDIPF